MKSKNTFINRILWCSCGYFLLYQRRKLWPMRNETKISFALERNMRNFSIALRCYRYLSVASKNYDVIFMSRGLLGFPSKDFTWDRSFSDTFSSSCQKYFKNSDCKFKPKRNKKRAVSHSFSTCSLTSPITICFEVAKQNVTTKSARTYMINLMQTRIFLVLLCGDQSNSITLLANIVNSCRKLIKL